jgi:hypothetical protein
LLISTAVREGLAQPMPWIRKFELISGLIGFSQLTIQSAHGLTEIGVIFGRGLLKGRMVARTGWLSMSGRTMAIWRGQVRFKRLRLGKLAYFG